MTISEQRHILKERLGQIVDRLRERGGRITPQRLAILEALLDEDHPTVEQIHARVACDFPTTSVVTVYRTLATLQEMGEVLEVQSADPVAHYDGYRPDQHSHLVCVSCGRVTDSPTMDMQNVIAALGREAAGWQINEEAQFHGICPDCQQKGISRGDEGGA